MKVTKILAPTDLSQLSRSAVRYALEIGLEQGSEVIVYHGISEDGNWFGKDDPFNPASAFIPQQKERLPGGLTCPKQRSQLIRYPQSCVFRRPNPLP
jgi:nucleotide-binding universal stress UspA family protein